MTALKAFLRLVDQINEQIGRLTSWLVLILTVVIGYDVAARYVFNAPTAWGFEVSYQLGGVFYWLGMAYTLRHRGHVRIDLLANRFSVRGQALVETVFYVLFFFCLWGGMLYFLFPFVLDSWLVGERSTQGYWQPIIYPFKTVILAGTLLLLLQGLAEFIRSLVTLIRGERP